LALCAGIPCPATVIHRTRTQLRSLGTSRFKRAPLSPSTTPCVHTRQMNASTCCYYLRYVHHLPSAHIYPVQRAPPSRTPQKRHEHNTSPPRNPVPTARASRDAGARRVRSGPRTPESHKSRASVRISSGLGEYPRSYLLYFPNVWHTDVFHSVVPSARRTHLHSSPPAHNVGATGTTAPLLPECRASLIFSSFLCAVVIYGLIIDVQRTFRCYRAAVWTSPPRENHGRTPYAGALRSRLRRVCRWASFSFASVR
jgi:hypothetical protein